MGLEEEEEGERGALPTHRSSHPEWQAGEEFWGSQGALAAQMFPPIPADAVLLGQIDLNSPESCTAAPVSPNRRCRNFVRKIDVPRFNFSIV